jgi:hypothetical protein
LVVLVVVGGKRGSSELVNPGRREGEDGERREREARKRRERDR